MVVCICSSVIVRVSQLRRTVCAVSRSGNIMANVNINVRSIVREIWCSCVVQEGPKIHTKLINKWPVTNTFQDIFNSLNQDGKFDQYTIDVTDVSASDRTVTCTAGSVHVCRSDSGVEFTMRDNGDVCARYVRFTISSSSASTSILSSHPHRSQRLLL
jgi:hypothetical protein